MKKAYIILAHKNIEQLLRLVKRLDDHFSLFYIHIDKKLNFLDLELLTRLPGRVQIMDRMVTRWAGFSLVEATLKAMRAAKDSQINFHTITLLSGQDYPIKSNDYINKFFQHSEQRIFMEHFKIPNYEKWQPRGGMYRLDKYFFGLKPHQLFSSRAVNLVSRYVPFLRRNQPKNLQPYAGSQWWTIDSYALDYILHFVDQNPGYSKYHRSTFAPDEVFFQTILLNATDERITKSIVNDNKRFARWQTENISHPEFLNAGAFDNIINSPALFARKFDLEQNPEIFELIDKCCLSKEAAMA